MKTKALQFDLTLNAIRAITTTLRRFKVLGYNYLRVQKKSHHLPCDWS